MSEIHFLIRAAIVIAFSVIAQFAGSGVSWSEEASEVDGGGALDHAASLLPDDPPIRFRKMADIMAPNETQAHGHLAFSQDGKTLAASRVAGRKDPNVALWDVETWKLLYVLPHANDVQGRVSAIAFVPPGDRLVTACYWLNRVFLWDVKCGKLLDTLELETGGKPDFLSVTGLAAFPDGQRVLCCACSGLIVWNVQTKTHTKLALDEYVPIGPLGRPSFPRCCYNAAFAGDGSRFATTVNHVYFEPRILLWDANTCRVTGVIPIKWLQQQFAMAPDGSSIAADYYGEKTRGGDVVSIWRTAMRKQLFSGRVFDGQVRALTFTRDGKYLLAAGDRKNRLGPGPIGVWDVDTGKIVARLEQFGIGEMSLAISPDNKLLAVPYGVKIQIYSIEYASRR